MFQFGKYEGDKLFEVVHHANRGLTPIRWLESGCNHIRYLRSYLGSEGLGASFYLAEDEYINFDYLTDHGFYYDKCFEDYPHKCVRIHYFLNKGKYGIDEFKGIILNQVVHGTVTDGSNTAVPVLKNFWNESYLGFIVVRPIPMAFLGYTILKHYNHDSQPDPHTAKVLFNGNRKFWGVKEYSVHLFGITIKVPESLAFMSQDGNVAACATISIWCMLNRAAEDYYICLKSPSEITKDAGEIISSGDRIFPNDGLDLGSMCRAISRSNIAPEVRLLMDYEKGKVYPDANRRLKKLINAYAGLRIPIILGLNVPYNGKLEGHAVAVCGHYADDGKMISTSKHKTLLSGILGVTHKIDWNSDSIEQLYAHDDQFGPFSRIVLGPGNKIYTSWSSDLWNIKESDEPAYPIALIIPVYQKVRIPFEDIEQFSLGLNDFLIDKLGDELDGISHWWDIQLKYSTDFKSEIREKNVYDKTNPFEFSILKNLLIKPLPKYVWISTMYIEGEPFISFIYDATALKNSDCLLFAFAEDVEFWSRIINDLDSLEPTYDFQGNVLYFFNNSLPKFRSKFSEIFKYAKNETAGQ